MNAKLIKPTEDYLPSYLEACREFKAKSVRMHSLMDPDRFHEWRDTLITSFEDARLGRNLREGIVPQTTLWLVEDGEFIGYGNLRHRLTESLERMGGHIGYAIRPSRWGKGYGTWQLKLLLSEAAKLGIREALLTCDDRNIGSYRVMEKNGGVLQDNIVNTVDGEAQLTRR
jgi:predicted acetyltransferase